MVYGVDGCRGRRAQAGRAWLVVALGADRFGSIAVAESFRAVVAATPGAELVLVDIPIGLPDGDNPTRLCDAEARRALGTRGSSVFPAPVREAFTARDYVTANAENRRVLGKGLSRQAWGICPRIADVDAVLRAQPGLRARYRESHPEVCFAALNRWRPALHAKRTGAGGIERLATLSRCVPGAAPWFAAACARWTRAEVAPHDVLDAMALAVTAREALAMGCPTIPPEPPRDAQGMLMEMVCPRAR